MKKQKRILLNLDNNNDYTIGYKTAMGFKFTKVGRLVLSVASGFIIAAIYQLVVKDIYLTTVAGFLGAFMPYFAIADTEVIKRSVANSQREKEFVQALVGALRSTNSTQQALLVVKNEITLSEEIDGIVTEVIRQIRLGTTVVEALKKGESLASTEHMRVVLSILRINHETGSSMTIKGLEGTIRTLDDAVTSSEFLREKIAGITRDRVVMLAMLLLSPVAMAIIMPDMFFPAFDLLPAGIIMAFIFVLAGAGNFVQSKMVEKMVKQF